MPDGSVQFLSAPRRVSPIRGARILSARRPLPYRSFSAFAVRGCFCTPRHRMGIADQPYWPRFFCKRFSGSSRNPRLFSHRCVFASYRLMPHGRAVLAWRVVCPVFSQPLRQLSGISRPGRFRPKIPRFRNLWSGNPWPGNPRLRELWPGLWAIWPARYRCPPYALQPC
jgi:hypothetical protein